MIEEKDYQEELDHELSGDYLSLKERTLFDLIKMRKGIITVREMQDILGWSSTSCVDRYLKKLHMKNYIRPVKGYVITKEE
jgi:uncharacterized membrane protein